MGDSRARANPKIQDLLQEACFLMTNRQSKAQIVSILESVLELLQEDGMLTHLQIPPKTVGVHPCIQVNNVHRLGANIVMRSGAKSEIADFTINLQSGSKKLGRSKHQEIDVGSLACGHTNKFLGA